MKIFAIRDESAQEQKDLAYLLYYEQEKRFYIERLKGWLAYLGRYDRFMFGTDWPLANLGDYIAFTKEIIPRAHWNQVFFENANRIYQLGL